MSLEKRSNCGSPYLLMLCVAILFSACNTRPKTPALPDYGVAYNHVRDSIGMKPVSEEWIGDTAEDGEVYFPNHDIDRTLKEPKAYYIGKDLNISNDSLIYEIDVYQILKFPTPDQRIMLSELRYTYFYYPIQGSGNYTGWYFVYFHNNSPGRGYIEMLDGRTRRDSEGYLLPMTRAEADSILATWGMKYP